MHRRTRRFIRRFAAFAPVLAALGGQALAAGSLRAPFLPHAGTTPAPWFPLLATAPTDADVRPRSAPIQAGIAALRTAAKAARRADLEARLEALLASEVGVVGPPDGRTMSDSRDMQPPGDARSSGRPSIDVTR
ncbi:MAG: hypothetical protein U1E39_17800 [Planctomycetota bacterium]